MAESKTDGGSSESSVNIKDNSVATNLAPLDLLKADVFHVDDEKKDKIHWSKLDIETRVQKIKEYFEREFNNTNTEKTIDKNTIDMLIDIVGKGQLRLKKEISFDEVNQRVIRITAVVAEPHTDHYVYKPETISQREKSRKAARTRLFRHSRKR